MSLPVNKKTLDTIISANIPDNSEQLITAEKLRETLNPIVNSTYGLKTIWAGRIYINYGFARTGYPADSPYWFIIENYYDPNYFQIENSSIMTDPLNKYIVTNPGSGLLADNGTPNGTFTNKNVTNLQTGFGGSGLTFNGTITSGVLTSISVNNPGAGFMYGLETPVITTPAPYIQTFQLNVTNSGNPPQIQFNLSNTIAPAFNDQQFYQNGWVYNVFNVFIPSKLTKVGSSECIQLSWTDSCSSNIIYEKSISRISPAVSDTTGGNIRSGQPGFQFSINCTQSSTLSASDRIGTGFLEIKVPIINTTV